jgi:hypothetical protein
MGTYNTDENNEPITGGDGNPEYIPHKTGNGKMIFWDRDEFVTYITKNANPYEFSKYSFTEMNAKKQRKLDADNFASLAAAKSGTKTGQLKDELTQAQIDKLDREKTGDRKTPAQQPVASIETLSGETRELTTAEAQSMKALSERLSKKFPESLIDEEVAGKIMEVRNNKDYRAEFSKFAIQAVKGTGKISPREFRKLIKDDLGMPIEFADKLLEEAELLSEADLAKKTLWDKLLGLIGK